MCKQALTLEEIETAVAGQLPASPLAALVAKVDEERVSALKGADLDLAARHKALVRAAGRAAIEETLNPTRHVTELTAESLAAEWLAYAEVFGTNGMAAGGARSATGDLPSAHQPRSDRDDQMTCQTTAKQRGGWQCGLIGASILAVVALVLFRRTPLAHGSAI